MDVPASIDFEIFGMKTQIPPASSASITMTEGQHDLIELTINSPQHDLLSQSLSLPLQIRWGTTAVGRTVLGYVDTPSPQVTRATAGSESMLFALGVSSKLRDSHPRVWKNSSPFVIASDILNPAQFGVVMDAYPYLIDNFSQASDESDWRTLGRLARKMGYSLIADGVNVLLIDPRQELARTKGYYTFTIPVNNSVMRANASEFVAEMSATPFGTDFKNYEMTGVDAQGNVFTYKTEYSPEFGTNLPTVTAQHPARFDSVQSAQREADRVSRMARWTMKGTMACRGNADFRPGKYVHIQDPSGPSDGFWYVTEAQHVITVQPDSYQCVLTMCKEHLATRRPYQKTKGPLSYPNGAVITQDNTWRPTQKVSIYS